MAPSELYVFKVKNSTHVRHPNIGGDGDCFGRVMRLAYPFGWQHFYCQQACCDHRGERCEDTGEEVGRVHVACVVDFTFTDYSYCIDCGRVGVIEVIPNDA